MVSNPLFESEYIFGIHEPGGEELMLEAGKPGWVMFSEALGHDPDDRSGVDYSSFSKRGLGVIVRLNHGYEPDGTIPHSSQYELFARRIANFVATSRGCKIWVIGNEMNYAVERPGIHIDWSRHNSRRDGPAENADPMRRGLAVRFNILPEQSTEIRTTRGAIISPGEPIEPEMYARCYRLCRDAIHRLPGHEDDQVLVGAVAPWNTQTLYAGNPNGDWVLYFRHILERLGPDNCDGFTIHAYTHGADSGLISSAAKLSPPFQSHHVHFRVFADFMNAVPSDMRHLAAYISETGQSQPWSDRNDSWIQRAYAEIDAWNHGTSGTSSNPTPNQKIRALILYRWPQLDKWYIEGKTGVEIDFQLALTSDYKWVNKAQSPESTVQGRETRLRRELSRTGQGDKETGRRGEGEKRRKGKSSESEKSEIRNPKSKIPYLVEWVADHMPEKLLAGETISVLATLRNAGTESWPIGGGNPVRIGYNYFRSRKKLQLTTLQEARTDLPGAVAAGETVSVAVRVVLPEKAGNYTLEIDLVQEGVGWFKEQKSPVLSRWLTVESPAKMGSDGKQQPKRDLPVPLFMDVAASLPRSVSPYARRNLNQIKYVVISHTGANPALPLDRLADVHIAAGYPGIVYDFVVDASGQVFRTKEMETTAQPDQPWSEQGVNVCLAGNFASSPPPLAQLDAAGRICAWLAQNLGLDNNAIVGLGELTRSDNPGVTFYRGPSWKGMITRQVQLHMAALGMGALDSGKLDEIQTQLQTLKTDNSSLREQVRAAESDQEKLRSFNERLQAELVARQRQLEAVREESGNLRLRIIDDTFDLPRDAKRYRPRRPDSVRYLVIHHTAADSSVPLRELAEAQRREWPSILYDYVIDSAGGIHQTQPSDEVIATAEPYLSAAIGIAFAGNFERVVPTNEQIHAGGQLVGWLMEKHPQLNTDCIMGVSEFTDTTSPGGQWMTGKRWKERLLASVRRASGQIDPSDVENELRARLEDSEQRLEHAQRTVQSLTEVHKRLETDNLQLQSEVQQRSTQPVATYVVPQPAIRNIIEQLPRHPTLRYERRALNQITHIAIHHTATPPSLSPIRIAELHIAADPTRGKEGWPGIGYHFIVHADGSIDQCNGLEMVSFHVYRHYSYSVGVCFAGSFMNGKIPTSAQLRAGAHLVSWLMQEMKIPLARVWGHREFPENVTICPGSEWTQGNRWRDLLFERVELVQSGAVVKLMRHYLLLWQRAYPGPMARQDLVNGVGYIARFRPAVGFSPEDAKNAEYVTILGNEAGVSAATEKMLVDGGCKVERIAGRNDEDTSHMLAEMVRAGRRFRGYEVDF